MIKAIIQNRNLKLYFIGRFISSIGNHFSFFAQSVAAYILSDSSTAVGLLWLLRGTASLLLIPFGGSISDQYNRKNIILVTDLISGILAISYLFLTPSNYVWLLPLLVFLSQGINRFYDPAAKASFKEVSKDTDLELSGAFSAIIGQIAVIIGPLLAALIYSTTHENVKLLFFLDGITFLFSFIMMLFVNFGEMEQKNKNKDSFYGNIRSGSRYIMNQPQLLYLILLLIPVALCGKVIEVLVLDISNFSIGTLGGIGLFFALFAFGGIIGSTQINRYKNKLNNFNWYIGLTATAGVLLLVMGLFYSVLTSIVLTFLLGMVINTTVVMAQINIQKNCDSNYLGRIFSTWTFLAVIGGAIGASMSGIISDYYSFQVAFIIFGLIMLLPIIIKTLLQITKANKQVKIDKSSN